MVRIDVAVAAGPDKVTDAEAGLLGHHMREQRVGRNIERHTEENIGAALVELAGQLAVSYIELKERVAGRQLHARNVGHIPGRHDQTA